RTAENLDRLTKPWWSAFLRGIAPAVAAGPLRFIERRVGAAKQGVDGFVTGPQTGEADAARPRDFAGGRPDDERSTRFGQARRERLSPIDRRFRQRNGELFAAEAADEVRRPALAAQHVRKRSQHHVAGLVAEPVVHALEQI